ncbi:unnamed protein product [Medioppia subpectinata]|uniref:Myotrophin n=1 Tax=Medioppia subpectinata TaxID=1979941 RepID=A0A7R9KYH8_9ACAR|nr:unnamed protein product [Medioppia subpectinata]CAG2112218.1 unnamed protein product [Medioppia subpectinata]
MTCGNDSSYLCSPSSVMSPTYGTLNGRTEQNQLNNTLHKLVAKVIDVSSIDNNIEQSDWNERQRTYGHRLAGIKKPLLLKSKHLASQQTQVNPINSRNLTVDPISEEDLNLINYFSERASLAVHNGFKVHCEESFTSTMSSSDLVWSLKNGDLDSVKELFESKKVDVNASLDGRSAIHYAADYGHKDIIEYLIGKGVELNVVDKHGITPLLAAIWEGHTECVRLMIAGGAHKSGQTPDGKNYLEAAEKPEIKSLLK